VTLKQKKQTVDFAERVSATFVQAFLAVALVTGVSDKTALVTAATAGALAAGKFIYAKVQAYTTTPSTKAPDA
jgi:hypothetical protein